MNFVNAPDGTLYCIDMAREYSESVNIPADVEKQMDLQSGKDRGRIYRIAPPGFRQPPPPRLRQANTAELVAALESPHGWWRDTAHRLLFERQDPSAVPALERLLLESDSPQARVHALWSLQGLGALSDGDIVRGLSDSHAGVRENGVRLAEARLDDSAAVREQVLATVSDTEPRVRLQVAFTLGESKSWGQSALLARMARENLADSWIQSAIISSAADCGGELFAALTDEKAVLANAKGLDFLRQLGTAVGFQNRPADVTRAIGTLAAIDDPVAAFSLLNALGNGLKLAGTTLAAADREGKTKSLLQQAPNIATDAARSEPVRLAAIEALGMGTYGAVSPALKELLAPNQTPTLQLVAIKVLRQFNDPHIGGLLLERYSDLAPDAKSPAIDALLERAVRVDLLLTALKDKTVPRDDLSAVQVSALRQQADARLLERVTEVLGVANNAKREHVYQSYLPALDLTGVAERGQATFVSRCAACHRFAGIGLAFGPDLNNVATGGKNKLLIAILDPNRDVAPDFFFQVVVTNDDLTVSGIRKDETAASLTLLMVGGITKTIAKSNIADSKIRRQSLMPDGLEAGLTHQTMADLIEFLIQPGPIQSK